ncbi:hypothetical protein [Haloarchaeobius sp. DFWS5]|uniref:hypothetical protein n=1 Tax=Haloarchaeobius sp. DFWS5 TaxID=3446114 RepID=UPI003EBE6E7F
MPELSLPTETTVGDPLPVRLTDGPVMEDVSVRFTVTDDADRELEATAVYSTTTDGELDTTKATLRRGGDLGGPMPLAELRPEDEYLFPYAIFDESGQVSIAVSAKVDGELLHGETIRTLVSPDLQTETVAADDEPVAGGTLFHPPGDDASPAVVFLADPETEMADRLPERLASSGVAVFVPDYDTARVEGGDEDNESISLDAIEGAFDSLTERDDVSTPLSLVGVGRGTEAAALLGASRSAVDTVVAYAPTAYAFPVAGTEPATARWHRDGESVSCLPLPSEESVDDEESSFFERTLSEASLDEMDAAALPWADVPDVTVVSGGHDTVWPATAFCERIGLWRRQADRETIHLDHPDAGHGVGAPYRDYRERVPGFGGSALGDTELATDAWPAIVDAVRQGE